MSALCVLAPSLQGPTPKTPPPPPHKDFTSPYDVNCPMRGWLYTALLPPPWQAHPGARGTAPALEEYVGTPWGSGHVGQAFPPTHTNAPFPLFRPFAPIFTRAFGDSGNSGAKCIGNRR